MPKGGNRGLSRGLGIAGLIRVDVGRWVGK